MFAKETYVQRRAQLKKTIGSGVLLFLGNDEQGLNYEDNTFRYRQDSTFLYYFGLSFAGLSALIDIDEDKEIIFGDELTIDHIVWMGTQPTLHEKASAVGISETRPFAAIVGYLLRTELCCGNFRNPTFCRHRRLSAQGCTEGTDHPLFAPLSCRA